MSKKPIHELTYTIEYECGKCGERWISAARVPNENEFTDRNGNINIAMHRCEEQAKRDGWSWFGTIQHMCPKCMAKIKEIQVAGERLAVMAEMDKDRKWWRK